MWGRHGRDRYMVVRFLTSTYSIYWCNQCLSPLMLWVWIQLGRGVLDTALCEKFVSDLRQVSGFLLVPWVSSTNKTDCLWYPQPPKILSSWCTGSWKCDERL